MSTIETRPVLPYSYVPWEVVWRNTRYIICSWHHLALRSGNTSVFSSRFFPSSSKKKERVPFCQEQKKILGESDWYWRSSTLASRFRTNRSPSNQNLSYKKLKPRFPFTHASTNVDTKPTASNRMLRGCLSIRCLASQHISRFFHFWRDIFLNAPQSDRDKKVSAMGYFSQEILIHRHWRQEVLLSHWFAISGSEIISWRGASCLRTFMS